jgi:hypothetical protein
MWMKMGVRMYHFSHCSPTRDDEHVSMCAYMLLTTLLGRDEDLTDTLVIEDGEKSGEDGEPLTEQDNSPTADALQVFDIATLFKMDRAGLLASQREGAAEILTLKLPTQLGCGRMLKVTKATPLSNVYDALDCRVCVDFMFTTPKGYLMPHSEFLRIGYYNLTNEDELGIDSRGANYINLVLLSDDVRALNWRQSHNSSYELTDEDKEIQKQPPAYQKIHVVLPCSDVCCTGTACV